jgi:hypothetical protein
MHEHVHIENLFKVKALVVWLAWLKIFITQTYAWFWLVGQLAIAQKVIVWAWVGMLVFVQTLLWLTPTGWIHADDEWSNTIWWFTRLCRPYYHVFDYNNDSIVDGNDLTILQTLILNNSQQAKTVCEIRHTTKNCDPNSDWKLSASDISYIDEIINGKRDAGELCDGIDNNCDGTIDNPDALRDQPLARNQNGICEGSYKICEQWSYKEPVLETITGYKTQDTPEACADGLDTSCSGTIDCNGTWNPGCRCNEGITIRVWIDEDKNGLEDTWEILYNQSISIAFRNITTQEEPVVVTFTGGTTKYQWLESGMRYDIVAGWDDNSMIPSPTTSIEQSILYTWAPLARNIWLYQENDLGYAVCANDDYITSIDPVQRETTLCVSWKPANIAGWVGQGMQLRRDCLSQTGGSDMRWCSAQVAQCATPPSDNVLLCTNLIPQQNWAQYTLDSSCIWGRACTYCHDKNNDRICDGEWEWEKEGEDLWVSVSLSNSTTIPSSWENFEQVVWEPILDGLYATTFQWCEDIDHKERGLKQILQKTPIDNTTITSSMLLDLCLIPNPENERRLAQRMIIQRTPPVQTQHAINAVEKIIVMLGSWEALIREQEIINKLKGMFGSARALTFRDISIRGKALGRDDATHFTQLTPDQLQTPVSLDEITNILILAYPELEKRYQITWWYNHRLFSYLLQRLEWVDEEMNQERWIQYLRLFEEQEMLNNSMLTRIFDLKGITQGLAMWFDK